MTPAHEGRADVRDMLVVHETFRTNYARLPALVRAVTPGDTRRAAVVADHADLVEQFLHLHHKGEDELLWPKLLERAGDQLADTVQVLEDQHVEIAALLERSAHQLQAWRTRPAQDTGEEFASTLEELGALLTEHLAIEESRVLPVVPDYITSQEWHELGDHAISALPKNRLPIVFGMLAAHTDAEIVKIIISPAPLIPRLLMPVIGPPAYRRHARKVFASS